MTGAFVVRGLDGIQYYNSKATGAGDWPPRFAKATFAFDNGIELAYVDPRRFGKIKLVRDVKEVIGGLGVDPSKALPEGDAFAAMWKRRSAPIKTALMDQKIMAGIGNWMADGMFLEYRRISRFVPGLSEHGLTTRSRLFARQKSYTARACTRRLGRTR